MCTGRFCITLKTYIKHKGNAKALGVQTLDQNFHHNLMWIKDSWEEVVLPICLTNNWYDLELLLPHITQCLNSSNMNNPCPQIPTNPFTNQPLSADNYAELYDYIKSLPNHILNELDLNIDLATIEFILFLSKYKNQEFPTQSQIISHLETQFRFMRIPQCDAQDNFKGLWITNTTPLTFFEYKLKQLQQYPSHIYDENNDRLVVNREYSNFKQSLKQRFKLI